MPSFDIVSRIDLAEVDNALAGIRREVTTRFDFKGSKCAIDRNEGELALTADDDLKLKQMHELLKVHLTRRKVEPGALDFKAPEKAVQGGELRITGKKRDDLQAAITLIRGLKIEQPLQYVNFRE